MKAAASPRSRAQVAAVLAFVISHTTYLAAQDDETGRCPKVCDGRFPSYRHFERQREIFVIRGQVVYVWECSNGKPAIQGTFGHRPVSSS